MSIKEQAREKRHGDILKALEEPRTMKEVAELTGHAYHTVRKDIQEFIRDQIVSPTGMMRDGANLMMAKDPFAIPEFFIKAIQQRTDLARMAQNYVDSGFADPASVDLIRDFMRLPIYIMETIRALYEREVTPDGVQPDLDALRIKTQRAHQIVDSMSDLMKQYISNQVIWDARTLHKVAADVRFATAPTRENYEALLKHLSPDH